MTPIVYLQEADISTIFQRRSDRYEIVAGIAQSFDDHSVFHAFIRDPKRCLASDIIETQFIPMPSAQAFPTDDVKITSVTDFGKNAQPVLRIFCAIEGNVLKHRCFFVRYGHQSLQCEVRFVPEESELYSRSRGLLETGILKGKSIGVVGLGSGGSPVVIELAKAGIGNFVLIDFDRLELSNISRHVCGISDLGRYKTFAVRDAVLQKNPHAAVTTLEIDIIQHRAECALALSNVDLLICASDNDQSRFLLNDIALKLKIPAIFGRALTRASGGDVLRVRPFEGPCYSCLYSQNVRQEGSDDEEISQQSQAKRLLPDYTSDSDLGAVVQVGLSSDIAPISNFMVKLTLVQLSIGLNSGISTLEDDLIADFYIWANRRDGAYESWPKFGFGFDKPAILRWYGARVARDPACMVCGSGTV